MHPANKPHKPLRAASCFCILALLCLLAAACSSRSQAAAPGDYAAAKLAPAVTAALAELEAGHSLDGRTARGNARGQLQVYVYVTDISPGSVTRLMTLGLTDPEPVPSLGLVQGWIAPRDAGALTASPLVTRITLPRYAEHH